MGSPYVQLPITQWAAVEAAAESQIAGLGLGANADISGLECSTERGGGITYQGSEFGNLARIGGPIGQLNSPNLYTQDGISYAQVFQDPAAVFWPNTLVFLEHALSAYKNCAGAAAGEAAGGAVGGGVAVAGSYPFRPTNSNSQRYSMKKQMERNTDVFTNEAYLDRLAEQPWSTTFIEPYVRMLTPIFAERRPVCCLGMAKGEHSYFHGIAIVFHSTDTATTAILYDPIYYIKTHEQYLWPTLTATVILKLLSKKLERPITVINASAYCEQRGKLACPQYTINAEYCHFYSLFFLYKYASRGYPTDPDGIRAAVIDSYIVAPDELTRNPCGANHRYRLIMTSFILTVLACITKDQSKQGEIRAKAVSPTLGGFRFVQEGIIAQMKAAESAIRPNPANSVSIGSITKSLPCDVPTVILGSGAATPKIGPLPAKLNLDELTRRLKERLATLGGGARRGRRKTTKRKAAKRRKTRRHR